MINEAGQTGQPLADRLKRNPICVLHVEDDPGYREAIADQLSDHGFVVHGFADAMSLADGLAVSTEADIILLDWDLPEISGIELLVELRQVGVELPVVFLTGYGFKAQENLAFERGAVDFIDKARGVEILARRLRRLVRAPKSAAAPPPVSLVVCGKLVLNPNVGRAHWSNFDVDLTIGEYNIVHLLASNVGRWVTYRAIYDRLHYEGFIAGTGEDGYRTNVRAAIKRIRKKFLQCDKTFAEIETSRATATAGPTRLALAERGIIALRSVQFVERNGTVPNWPACGECAAPLHKFLGHGPDAGADGDHLKSVAEYPELRPEWSNLRAFCRPCHSRRTAREQGFARPSH